MDKGAITRRAFLAATTTSAVVALGAAAAPNTAKVVPKKLSPNEKLNVAAIGTGGKGSSDIMGCKNENIVAFCDVDWDRPAKIFDLMPNVPKFRDYRNMLESMPEIDAVTVSTPDHTHAPAAYMAMKMGKHVYVQKPLTHTVAEARLLTLTAREMGVASQMGNQFCRQCGYCQPCPNGINIPRILWLANVHRRYDEEWPEQEYGMLEETADYCQECGECEDICPYELPTREMLKAAHIELMPASKLLAKRKIRKFLSKAGIRRRRY